MLHKSIKPSKTYSTVHRQKNNRKKAKMSVLTWAQLFNPSILSQDNGENQGFGPTDIL